ncbi:hypothetical protein ABZ924_18690 [Streptomyces sp. NPDC046876]|uniref:PKD domain-containing protein n=1 Tax=Streptomyces sp. NPDC046876 TaxID=3155616 RepID=UPI0033C3E5D7
MAHAADPSTGQAKPHGVAKPDLAKVARSESTTFDSPADRSVKPAPADGKGKAAAPLTADTAADITVGLKAFTISAHGLEVDTTANGTTNPVSIGFDWGDGTTGQDSGTGGQTTTTPHQYAKPGGYTIKVTVTDQVTQASSVNQIAVWTSGSHYTPYGPTRLLDTRNGTGAPQGKVPAYTATQLKIAGNGAIPSNVTAVVLNLTVTNATSGGHITAYPNGSDRPTTSNVNFAPGQTVPNLVIVPVKNGYVDLYNGGWESVDLIADVTGYFTKSASSGYTPLTPQRLVDTRIGQGTSKGQVPGYGTFTTQVAGTGYVSPGATAVALNVTVTNPKSDGHLTVFPSGQSAPTASNLNFTTGQTVANSVIVPVGPDGKISVRNGAWNPTDVIVDVVGYYSKDSTNAFVPVKPSRLLDTRDGNTWAYGPLEGRGYIYMPLSDGLPHTKGFVLNSTVTNTKDSGYLAVTPDPNSLYDYKNGTEVWPPTPTSSNLNWTPGKTVPNLVQAATGPSGIIDFWNQSDGNLDLIVDIFGVYEDN